MFGIGMQEILLILVIALVVIGPKKLPEMAKALGKAYGDFRRTMDEVKSSVNVDLRTEEEKERIREIHARVQPPPPAAAPVAPQGPGESGVAPPPADQVPGGGEGQSAGGEAAKVHDPPEARDSQGGGDGE